MQHPPLLLLSVEQEINEKEEDEANVHALPVIFIVASLELCVRSEQGNSTTVA
jgi:hypothetical protein